MRARVPVALAVGLLLAWGAAAQDPEETRLPFQKSVSALFQATPLAPMGRIANLEIATVPAGFRLVITQLSAICHTGLAAKAVGPVALTASTPAGLDNGTVTHWFPVASQGVDEFQHCTGGGEQCWVPVKAWAASSPTHIYAAGGTTVRVSAVADNTPASPPASVRSQCRFTISGFLVSVPQ